MDDPSLRFVDAKTRLECHPPPGFRRATGARRRILALAGADSACQHVMSRMVDGLEFWDDVEKEALDRLLRKMAAFLGVRLLTHAVMGNHFHALLEIPNKEQWLARFDGPEGETAFWAHLATFYQGESLGRLRRRVEEARQTGRTGEADKIIDSIKRRMCDVSIWAKEVKERYSRWLNRRRNRQGTIWMDRFRNVLVQNGQALHCMALYIEMNPVRAGLAGHPRDYRWCGLAAAARGDAGALKGICRIHALAAGREEPAPEALSLQERLIDISLGGSSAEPKKNISAPRALRRERGYSEGMAMGAPGWLEEVACEHEHHFGRYRRGKPKEIAGEIGAMVLRMDNRGHSGYGQRMREIGPSGGHGDS
jgi:REP element-mobilizing transposase RayT